MSYASYQVATDGDQPSTSNHVSPEERSIAVRAGGVVSYSGGEATSLNTQHSLNLADTNPSGGIQARTKTGSPRYGELQMSDIVKVPGGETTLQNAAALGLVEQDQHGRWVLVPDGASRALANEPTHEEPQDDAQALPDASVEASLADLCSTIPGTSQVAVLQQLVSSGEILPGTLARAASEGGIEPSVLNDRINTVVQGFQHQAETMLKDLGADDASRFWEWAQDNHQAELQKAFTAHAMERTTKGYQPLFQQYIETLADHSPDDVLNAQFGPGITAQKIDGKVILDTPHGRMSYRSAVKAGIIKVTGA